MGRKVSREAGIAALVANPNIKQAAADCGVSEKTMHRWLKEPDFALRLAETQRDVTKRVMRSVVMRAERAADALNNIMASPKVSPHARVQAARTILEFAFKAVEIEDILTRIEALEQKGENS